MKKYKIEYIVTRTMNDLYEYRFKDKEEVNKFKAMSKNEKIDFICDRSWQIDSEYISSDTPEFDDLKVIEA